MSPERSEAIARLAEAFRLSEVDRARAALFSSITHDLRSPLTAIKAASTLLMQYELEPADRRELLEIIREGADGLDRLIANAIHLSRTRAGGLRPNKSPAAVDEVVSRTLERLRHHLRDHRMVLVIPEDLPEVPVDVVQLDQALANLLENAATFSPPGTEIVMSVLKRDSSLMIRVEDRGEGIPREEREHVFAPFVKLAAGGGAGLGLATCRAIAESHGGRVLIEDRPGPGCAIVMELPLDEASVVVPDVEETAT